ncbi:MAG: restriction endonuclease subunit S [Caldibacillus sp.]
MSEKLEWHAVTLEEIAEITGGGTPKREVHAYWNGNIPWATPTDITNNNKKVIEKTAEYITEEGLKNSSAKLLPAGTVLMTSRATIGYCAINTVPMATNQGFANFICKNNVYNLFLLYLLTFHKDNFEKLGSGSTFKEVAKSTLKSYRVEIPPLPEQRKIAAILSSVDEAIEKTEAIIEQTEKVKKGLMQQLLTKGIGHTKFKKTEIGEIPEEWEVKELKDLANPYDKYSFTGGPFGSDLTSEDYTEEGVQIIQLQNIKEGYFSNDYRIFTSEEKANQLFSCNIYPGDIIIAKMADPVARACIVPNHSKRFLMASDGIRLSVDKRKYVTEYVTYAINAPYFRKQAINNSTGTTRLRIGLSALRKLKILIPSYEEQQKIADIMTTIDQKIEFEKMKIKKLIDIKKSLMQSLLTGKVRVKVDEDEVTSS